VIDVAQRYYNLLSGHDQVRNARSNYDNARRNLTMLERFGETGNRSDIEVDQARQNFLQAEANLSRTQANYGRQLDQFKFFLGLPLDLDIGPDPAELDRLGERGLLRPDLDLHEAIETALSKRLDYKTQADRLEDSKRHVTLARRQFLPVLDVSFTYSTSQSDDEDRFRLDFRNNTTRGGLNLDLPLDWTPRRNNYRLALIERQQSERALTELRDALVLEVTDAWRQLEDLQFNYGIQQQAVRLAERRVRSAALMFEMGRATTRDLLEAEDALLASRNALTTALVNYTIQRLQFWNAVERLEIDPKGMWYE
jgi:outer membrane protein TolC